MLVENVLWMINILTTTKPPESLFSTIQEIKKGTVIVSFGLRFRRKWKGQNNQTPNKEGSYRKMSVTCWKTDKKNIKSLKNDLGNYLMKVTIFWMCPNGIEKKKAFNMDESESRLRNYITQQRKLYQTELMRILVDTLSNWIIADPGWLVLLALMSRECPRKEKLAIWT